MNTFQRAAVRAINGSIQIGARCWRWPWQEAAWRRRARRAALLAFGLWSLYRLSGQWHWIGGAAIALLLAKGYRDGFVNEPPQQLVDADHYKPDADAAAELDPADARQPINDSVLHIPHGYAKVPKDQVEGEPNEDDPEPETADQDRPLPSPAEIRQILIDSVRDLAGERRGVHLDQLHTVWSLEGDLGMDLSEFRRWVEQHGIPVRDSLKASGKTRIGIHVADLPRAAPGAPAATPPPAVPDDLLQDW